MRPLLELLDACWRRQDLSHGLRALQRRAERTGSAAFLDEDELRPRHSSAAGFADCRCSTAGRRCWLLPASRMYTHIQIIPGFFRLTHTENTGAAFSLFADSPSHWRTALLIGFSVVAMVVVLALLWKQTTGPDDHRHCVVADSWRCGRESLGSRSAGARCRFSACLCEAVSVAGIQSCR